jgi:subtilase family serine protease
VDGVLKREGHPENVEPNATRSVKDFNIGKLSRGTHTIRLVVDADDDVLESNEGDNEYTKTITVN